MKSLDYKKLYNSMVRDLARMVASNEHEIEFGENEDDYDNGYNAAIKSVNRELNNIAEKYENIIVAEEGEE